MAIATYKDLCIDAVDATASGRFWAGALQLELQVDPGGDARLLGPTPRHTVWINTVPEPVTVKQRVHLDVRAERIEDVVALGGEVVDAEHGFSYLEPVPGAPFESLVFVPVPEPKTVKNRIHFDVDTPDVQLLVDAGATLLRPQEDQISWSVLADPDGNEFCAFVE